jgi:hypothetical protein
MVESWCPSSYQRVSLSKTRVPVMGSWQGQLVLGRIIPLQMAHWFFGGHSIDPDGLLPIYFYLAHPFH